MHAVVRSYSGQGASELFEQLEQRNEEVKDLIGGVPGFVSYTAFRSSEGGVTVTVCQDKTGTDESLSASRRVGQGEHQRDGQPARDHRRQHGRPLQLLEVPESHSHGQFFRESGECGPLNPVTSGVAG